MCYWRGLFSNPTWFWQVGFLVGSNHAYHSCRDMLQVFPAASGSDEAACCPAIPLAGGMHATPMPTRGAKDPSSCTHVLGQASGGYTACVQVMPQAAGVHTSGLEESNTGAFDQTTSTLLLYRDSWVSQHQLAPKLLPKISASHKCCWTPLPDMTTWVVMNKTGSPRPRPACCTCVLRRAVLHSMSTSCHDLTPTFADLGCHCGAAICHLPMPDRCTAAVGAIASPARATMAPLLVGPICAARDAITRAWLSLQASAVHGWTHCRLPGCLACTAALLQGEKCPAATGHKSAAAAWHCSWSHTWSPCRRKRAPSWPSGGCHADSAGPAEDGASCCAWCCIPVRGPV